MASGINIFELYNSIPDEYKEKGIDKLKNFVNTKVIPPLKAEYIPKIEQLVVTQIEGSNLPDTVKPEITDLVVNQINNPRTQPGVKALAIEKTQQRINEEAQKNINDLCLSQAQTQKLLDLRNGIVNRLNSIKKKMAPIVQTVNTTALGVNTTISTVKGIRTAKTTVEAAIAAQAAAGLPPSPFYLNLQNIVNGANTVLDFLRFDEQGNSKLNPISEKLNAVAIPLGVFQSTITQIVNLLSILDLLIRKCDPKSELTDIDKDFVAIATQQNNSLQNQTQPIDTFYKGFNLSIEEESNPNSPNVKRRRAVGTNSQGIVLVSTPYSFTTNEQTLIDELKVIIDNLSLGNTQQL